MLNSKSKFIVFSLGLFLLSTISAAQNWTQIGNTINGSAPNNMGGNSTSISANGEIVAIGEYRNSDVASESGQIRVFQNVDANWEQLGQDLNGSNANDEFGRNVCLSSDGSTIAVGAWALGSDFGYVQVFEYNVDMWTQVGSTIYGVANGDLCGTDVSLNSNGTILSIGSPGNDANGTDSGHVRVFENTGGVWTQVGDDIIGEATGDFFGYAVNLSADGSILSIGGLGNDDNGNNSGHVRVFENVGNTWTQIGDDIDGESAGDDSGGIMDMNDSGDIVAIAAWRNDGNGNNSGHARIYENIAGVWTQLGEDIDGGNPGDQFGNSITINSAGNIVAIGANLNDAGGPNSGHVRIFEYIAGSWSQIADDIIGENSGDETGSSLALNSAGTALSIGARYNIPMGIVPVM